MDYYDIKQLKPIDKKDFISISKKIKTSQYGSIAVWGDAVGRLGDNIYSLKRILWINEDELLFEFKGTKIYVYNPKGFYVSEKMIAIKECDRVIWDEISLNLKIEYSFNQSNQELKANIIKGVHHLDVDMNQPCFRLFTW